MQSESYNSVLNSFGLIKAPPHIAAEKYFTWMNPILNEHGMGLEVSEINGSLSDKFLEIYPPKHAFSTRCIFLQTNSPWSVYLNNSTLGCDSATTMPVLGEIIGCDAVRVVRISQMHSVTSPNFQYPAVILEFYKPDRTVQRTIYAANDGGKWKFGQTGVPFPFEELESYEKKKIKDRLTSDMLVRYLAKLNLYPFDHSWYGSLGLMIQKTGELPEGIS